MLIVARTVSALGLMMLLAGGSDTEAAARADIDRRTQALRESASQLKAEEQAKQIEGLEAAIRKGEAASAMLEKELAKLEAQTSSLRKEKEALERVQVVLASGLIGALVTAAVAVFGAFANIRRSRAERELRQLEVIEKAYELREKGIPLPPVFTGLLGQAR